LPDEILKEAINYLKNKEYWEWYRIIEEERKKLKNLEKELTLKLENLKYREKALEEEKERLKNIYHKKIEELLSFWNEEFKKIIEEIKQKKIGYKKAVHSFDNLASKVFKNLIKKEEEIKEGDKVFVLPLKKEGEVLKVKDKMLEIKLGGFKIEVPKENVTKDYLGIEYSPIQYFKLKQELNVENPSNFYERIRKKEILKLLGLTVEEALDKIEKTLNKAFLEGVQKIYLVHGHGTGKLRESIRKYLKDHPLVKNFEFADPLEGGTGVTIVYLEEKN